MNLRIAPRPNFYPTQQNIGPLGYAFVCNVGKNPSFDFEARIKQIEQGLLESGFQTVVVEIGFDKTGRQFPDAWSLWAKNSKVIGPKKLFRAEDKGVSNQPALPDS